MCLDTQDVSAVLPLRHGCGQCVGGGTWFSLVRRPLAQCAGRRCSGCCTALPHLPSVAPDHYVLPVIHQFGAWGQGSGFERQVLWQGTKLETNEQMPKMPDNSVRFLKVLADTPQEEEDRRGRRSHFKPVGRGHATAPN